MNRINIDDIKLGIKNKANYFNKEKTWNVFRQIWLLSQYRN